MHYSRNTSIAPVITLIFLTCVMLALSAFIGCNGDDCPEPVKHTITITTDGSHCKLTGETGTDVTVNTGEWVVWDNQHGSDVQLNFGSSKRLFGVLKAVVYANTKLELIVLETAEPETHEYNVPCATTHPGPKIVVNPPN